MKRTENGLAKSAAKVGTWMFISGVLVIGPLGFVLLSALAYAMYFSNLALGMICIILLFTPLLFLAVWVPLLGASLILERSMEEERASAQAEATF